MWSVEGFIDQYTTEGDPKFLEVPPNPAAVCALVRDFASRFRGDEVANPAIDTLSPEDQHWLMQNVHGRFEHDFKDILKGDNFGMSEAPELRDSERYTKWLGRVCEKLRSKSDTDDDRFYICKLYALTFIILTCRTASNHGRRRQGAGHQAVFYAYVEVLRMLHSIIHPPCND